MISFANIETKLAATAAALPPELPPAICNTLFAFSSVTCFVLVKLHGLATGPHAPQLAILKNIYDNLKIFFDFIQSFHHTPLQIHPYYFYQQ